jgi:hypothetical protein
VFPEPPLPLLTLLPPPLAPLPLLALLLPDVGPVLAAPLPLAVDVSSEPQPNATAQVKPTGTK